MGNKVIALVITLPMLIGAASCETMPDHHPCLIYLKDGTCARYKLIDKKNLVYKFESWQPIESLDGGFALPKHEFEKVMDYVRNNSNGSCKSIVPTKIEQTDELKARFQEYPFDGDED